MDGFCGQILDSLENNQFDANIEKFSNCGVRIFCPWVEEWKTNKIGPNSDAIFEARLVRKYGSLKYLDLETKFSLRFYHPNMIVGNKVVDKFMSC